jgi:hypothetical protein
MRFHYSDEASGAGPEGLCARQSILFSGAHTTSQASSQPSTQCLSLGAKWLGVAELSPPSAEVKHTWNCTAFPSCLHLVFLIKPRDELLPFVFVYSSGVLQRTVSNVSLKTPNPGRILRTGNFVFSSE